MLLGCINTLPTEPLPADVERVAVDVCFAVGDGLGKGRRVAFQLRYFAGTLAYVQGHIRPRSSNSGTQSLF